MGKAWKEAVLILLSNAAVWGAFVASFALLNTFPTLLMPHPGDFEGQIELAIVCLIAYLAAVRGIERRAPTELSARHALPGLAIGTIAGIAMISLAFAILWVPGIFQAARTGTFGALGPGFVYMLAVAVREEILYRGLVFRLLAKVAGTWGALLLSALWFAGWHAGNAGATPMALVDVALSGVLFGAAYAATGRLWLPIGLHAGWNFAEGSVFGTSVSGHDIGASLITGKLVGPDILTGGDFGAEASLVVMLVVLCAAAYLLWRTATHQRAEPPLWRVASTGRV